jgi:molybdopterin-guanine dinucleotide biosynthesis protein A
MEHPVCEDVTAFVLTGGRSERMGSDKALLTLPDGETLLEHAMALGASVAREVCLVGPRERYASYAWAGKIVEDVYPGRGPLAGIHAALRASSTEWNLIVAVDTPLLTSALLRWLIDRAKESSGAVVTLPRVNGQWQPLCAVYRREFGALAQSALEEGRYKIDLLYRAVQTRVLEEDELRAAGFGAELFGNLNTMEEMKNLLAGEYSRKKR